MQVDKITLQDIGLFDNEEHPGLANHLNFCKSNGGKDQLDIYLHNPLGSILNISERQQALAILIKNVEFVDAMKITNGTCLVIEKFFETSFKTIPIQISLPGAYWYLFWNKADYSLIKYSVEHLVIFVQGLKEWVRVFEKENENPVIEKLVQRIKKLVEHPELHCLNDYHKITNPQEILSLGYFFLYRYKQQTRNLLDHFYELDALYSLS